MQKDINTLAEWARECEMVFSTDKCKVMRLELAFCLQDAQEKKDGPPRPLLREDVMRIFFPIEDTWLCAGSLPGKYLASHSTPLPDTGISYCYLMLIFHTATSRRKIIVISRILRACQVFIATGRRGWFVRWSSGSFYIAVPPFSPMPIVRIVIRDHCK